MEPVIGEPDPKPSQIERYGFAKTTRAYGIGLLIALGVGIVAALGNLTDVPDDLIGWLRFVLFTSLVGYSIKLMEYLSWLQKRYGPDSLSE